jgi:predicted metal-dependent hydrolase
VTHAHLPAGQAEGEPIDVEAFKAEVRAWAARIGVEPREIRVASMKQKWASCSSRGRLTFDAGLLAQSKTFRAQVIVHELLHLKVPNHGPLFRSLLRAHLGEAADPVPPSRSA